MQNGKSTICWKQSGEDFVRAENTGPEQQQPEKGPIEIRGEEYPLCIAAHHIIPGKASLPKSKLADYIWRGKKIEGDIGYDVDGSENGVWLPTHQSMSAGMGKAQTIVINDDENPERTSGPSWAELSERAKANIRDPKFDAQRFIRWYTQEAMDIIGAQFHDSHADYNQYVIKILNSHKTRMMKLSRDCSECTRDKLPPPFMLGFWLNSISRALRTRFLECAPHRGWTGVYTSDFAKIYASTPLKEY